MTMTDASTNASAAGAQVRSGVVPYLTVDGAARAAEFYAKAFGATEVRRHDLDDQGRTMHIHLHIHDASVMLSDAYPEHGHPMKEPQGFMLHIQDDDPRRGGTAPWPPVWRCCCRCS